MFNFEKVLIDPKKNDSDKSSLRQTTNLKITILDRLLNTYNNQSNTNSRPWKISLLV